MTDPLAEVTSWDETAERFETPCADGRMVWRSWGTGRPILLLHGGAGSWRHWIRTLPALTNRRILAPDTPGLGDSDLPPAPWSAPSIGRVVADGITQLLGPDQEFDIVGFSFGSIITSTTFPYLAERVGTLLLVGASGLGLPRGKVVLEKVRNKTGAERVEAHRANLASLMIHDPAKIDDQALAIQEWNTNHARLTSVGLSPSAILRDSLTEALPRSHAKLCAVWGSEDAVSRDTMQARIAAMGALQPGADIRLIEGAGHWVAYEAADQFNAIALEMLGQP